MDSKKSAASYIRENTQHLHKAVEKVLQADAIFSPGFTLPQYIRLLQSLYVAHRSLEAELQLYPDLQQTIDGWSKSSFLEDDLNALNTCIPASTHTVTLINETEAWGALYVIQGSALGAQVIFKRLRDLNWPAHALNFYGSNRIHLKKTWSTFLAQLEAHVTNESEALKGAEKAYEVFIEAAYS
jgi:heme oxygenase